jgi:hypothetical protein
LAEPTEEAASPPHEVDLKDPLIAAGLALCLPGLGHFYQKRTAKAILFMVCILGTFFFGWDLGGRKVVYASWRQGDRRWPYLCQVWVGLPAWPALIQTGFGRPLGENFMVQPDLVRETRHGPHELDRWHKQYHGRFELGTVFTMIAGLLNVLVIFDAAAGPVGSSPNEPEPGGRSEQSDKKKTGRSARRGGSKRDPDEEEPATPTDKQPVSEGVD